MCLHLPKFVLLLTFQGKDLDLNLLGAVRYSQDIRSNKEEYLVCISIANLRNASSWHRRIPGYRDRLKPL